MEFIATSVYRNINPELISAMVQFNNEVMELFDFELHFFLSAFFFILSFMLSNVDFEV